MSGKAKDDELHQKFREALAKKNAKHDAHPGTGPQATGLDGHKQNDKTTRQFRRKAGS